MKFAFVFLFAAALGVGGAPAWGQLTWQSREFTRTASADDTQAVATYAFRNNSQQPVEIVSVSSSCGCTAAKPDKTIYQPGEAGQIEAIFTFGSRTGDQRKTITVRTRERDGKTKHESLALHVTIPVLAKLDPGFLFWRPPAPGSPAPAPGNTPAQVAVTEGNGLESKTVRVTFDDDQPMRVLSAESSVAELKTEIREVQAGKIYDVIVTPRTVQAGMNATITIHTDAQWPRWKTLQVRARMLGGSNTPAREGSAAKPVEEGRPEHLRAKLVGEPHLLMWGLGESANARTVTIEPVEGMAVHDVQARIMGEGFSVRLEEASVEGKYVLTVTPASTASPSHGMVMVTYSTDENQRTMPLRIPVRVWPARPGANALQSSAVGLAEKPAHP